MDMMIEMKTTPADIIREYGPFKGVEAVHGVSYDGRNVWYAAGETLNAFDADSGEATASLSVAADAGTAYDGEHLYQIAAERIRKIDPNTGETLAEIPAPGGGCSGLTWAEGSLWVGQYQERRILQIDPKTGEVLRTIRSDRFVTGVTWSEGELWHGTWESDESEIRRIDPETGVVLEAVVMPEGKGVSGLEAGPDRFFAGGGRSGLVRAVGRPGKTRPS